MASKLISFIVPTRNSARTLESCLQSLRNQTWPEVEIVVVDNNSSDQTPVIARRLADRVACLGPERSAQRNHGAELSSGEVLAFIDSDMKADPELAEDLAALFSSGEVAAAVIPELALGDNFWASCKSLEKRLYLGDPSVEAARAFRREAFFAAGGYDGDLTGPEDWDLPDRLKDQGLLIGRVETMVWHDEGAPTLLELFRKKKYYSKGLRTFARSSPRRAATHLNRLSLLRNPHVLVQQPIHTAGLALIKGVEVAGLLAGLGGRRDTNSPLSTGNCLDIEIYAHRHPQFEPTSPLPSLLLGALNSQGGAPGRVVDVGCGEGGTLKALLEIFPEIDAVGFDLSFTRSTIAQRRGLAVSVGDTGHLPVSDNTADGVVCRHVIEHVGDDQSLMIEAARVLKAGGFLYIETPLRLPHAWYFHRNREGRRVLDPTHVREYELPQELRRLVENAGLECLAIEQHAISYPVAHLIYRAFGGRGSGRPWVATVLNKLQVGVRVPRYRELRCLARKPT